MIRKITKDDYAEVTKLLIRYNLSPLTQYEMFSGHGIVDDEDGKIVGFMWALVSGSVACIDYLVVDEDCRQKAPNGRSLVGMSLAARIFTDFVKMGVTKYIGIMDNRPGCETMLRFYRELGMVERKPFAVVKGNPQEAWDVLKKRLEEHNG